MRDIVMDSQEAADADSERTLALLGVTREQVLAEIAYRQRRKVAAAAKRMAAAQRAGGVRRVIKSGDGEEGYQEMMIDPVSYHYWGQRLGYACWEDKGFRREYLRDNETSRVKTMGAIGMETAAMRLNQAKYRVRGKRGRWAA